MISITTLLLCASTDAPKLDHNNEQPITQPTVPSVSPLDIINGALSIVNNQGVRQTCAWAVQRTSYLYNNWQTLTREQQCGLSGSALGISYLLGFDTMLLAVGAANLAAWYRSNTPQTAPQHEHAN